MSVFTLLMFVSMSFATAAEKTKKPCNNTKRDYSAILKEHPPKSISIHIPFFVNHLKLDIRQHGSDKKSDEVELLRNNIKTIVTAANNCDITDEQFRKKLDAYTDYTKSLAKLEQVIETVKNAVTDKEDLEILEDNYKEVNSNLSKVSKDLNKLESVLKIETTETRKLVNNFIIKTSNEISSLRDEIEGLNKRVTIVENKLKSWEEGKLESTSIIFTAGAYKMDIDEDDAVLWSVGIQFLLADKDENSLFPGLAPFVEIGGNTWEEEKNYDTAPVGGSVPYPEDNRYRFIGGGLRNYFNFKSSLRPYLGAAASYVVEKEKGGFEGMTYGILYGLYYRPKSTSVMFAFEARYHQVAVSEQNNSFDAFSGFSSYRRTEKDSIWFYGFNIGWAF